MPAAPADRGALHAALTQLAEQDPLIDLRQDDVRQEIVRLALRRGAEGGHPGDAGRRLRPDGRPSARPRTICIERPVGTGAAVELIGKAPNPFLATVGLRVEPAPVGTGVEFRLEVELGSMPYAFFRAVEETVRRDAAPGPARLAGHRLRGHDDALRLLRRGRATRTRVFDKSMSSTAGDFRNLTPLVLMAALRQAGTRVYEPMHRFRLELPGRHARRRCCRCWPGSARCRGRPAAQGASVPAGGGRSRRPGCTSCEQQLPALTRGEGVLETRLRPLPAGPRPGAGPARGPTTTRSTARSTCCTSSGGSRCFVVRAVQECVIVKEKPTRGRAVR